MTQIIKCGFQRKIRLLAVLRPPIFNFLKIFNYSPGPLKENISLFSSLFFYSVYAFQRLLYILNLFSEYHPYFCSCFGFFLFGEKKFGIKSCFSVSLRSLKVALKCVLVGLWGLKIIILFILICMFNV